MVVLQRLSPSSKGPLDHLPPPAFWSHRCDSLCPWQ